MRHGVAAAAAAATRDRLVIQIPILAGKAYAEHERLKHIYMGLMASVAAGFYVEALPVRRDADGGKPWSSSARSRSCGGRCAGAGDRARRRGDCCADEAAVCGRLAQHMKHDDGVEMEAGSGVTVLQVNGINCGGCKKSLAAALVGVAGVKEFSIETKSDTGKHTNKVEGRGGSADAIRDAIAALDAGRGVHDP